MAAEGRARAYKEKRLTYGIFSVIGYCFLGAVVSGGVATALGFWLFYLYPWQLDNPIVVRRAYIWVTALAYLGWMCGLFWSLMYEGRKIRK